MSRQLLRHGPAVFVFGTLVLKSPKIKLKKFMKGVLKFLASLDCYKFWRENKLPPLLEILQICLTHLGLEILSQKPRPMEIPHGFFLNTLVLEIPCLF